MNKKMIIALVIIVFIILLIVAWPSGSKKSTSVVPSKNIGAQPSSGATTPNPQGTPSTTTPTVPSSATPSSSSSTGSAINQDSLYEPVNDQVIDDSVPTTQENVVDAP